MGEIPSFNHEADRKFSEFKVNQENIEKLKPKDQESKNKFKELFSILEEMVNCDYETIENTPVPSSDIQKIDYETLNYNNPIWVAKNTENILDAISTLNKLGNDLENNEEYKKIINEAVSFCSKKDGVDDRANSIKVDFIG